MPKPAQDPAYQPQPDPGHDARDTDAAKGEPSLVAPDGLRDVKAGEAGAPLAMPKRKPGTLSLPVRMHH